MTEEEKKELQAHRDAYQMCKADGWESPEEVLSAYKTLDHKYKVLDARYKILQATHAGLEREYNLLKARLEL